MLGEQWVRRAESKEVQACLERFVELGFQVWSMEFRTSGLEMWAWGVEGKKSEKRRRRLEQLAMDRQGSSAAASRDCGEPTQLCCSLGATGEETEIPSSSTQPQAERFLSLSTSRAPESGGE